MSGRDERPKQKEEAPPTYTFVRWVEGERTWRIGRFVNFNICMAILSLLLVVLDIITEDWIPAILWGIGAAIWGITGCVKVERGEGCIEEYQNVGDR